MFFKQKSKTQLSAKTISKLKNDAAPFIYFIDVLRNDQFSNPIVPTPSRIDKISIGSITSFIFPTKNISQEFNGKIYYFDFEAVYRLLLKNLLDYLKSVYKDGRILIQNFSSMLKKWWESSVDSYTKVQSYQEDLDYILTQFLDSYIKFLNGVSESDCLKGYLETMIDYCNQRIEKNEITYKCKKECTKRMFKEKKKHYYPDIWDIDVFSIKKERTRQKGFIPLLIYDDLLECFLYNSAELEKNSPDLMNYEEILSFGIIKETESSENLVEFNDREFLQNVISTFTEELLGDIIK